MRSVTVASHSSSSNDDVEHEPLAQLALRLAHAVARVEREPADLDRDRRASGAATRRRDRRRRAPRSRRQARRLPGHGRTVAAATARASATGRTSCTRNTLAPRSSASTLVAIVPGQALVRVPAAGELAEEALARGADHDRPADGDDLVEAAQQLEVVLHGLAEADAGVEPDALLGDPLARRRRRAAPRGTPSPPRPRRRSAGRPAWCAARRACARGSSRRPASATSAGHPGVEAEGGHVVHDASRPASSAARATASLVVSIETRAPGRRASRSTTGSTRRSSSSSGDGLGAGPGGLAAHVEDRGALAPRAAARARPRRRRRGTARRPRTSRA